MDVVDDSAVGAVDKNDVDSVVDEKGSQDLIGLTSIVVDDVEADLAE